MKTRVNQHHTEAAPKNAIRVFIVDDHDMVRLGLRTGIENSGDIVIVGEAGNGHEAVSLYNLLQPDIVLMDLVMPDMDGIEATRQILATDRRAKIIALTSFEEDDLIRGALDAGVSSYVLKDVSMRQLRTVIQDTYRGKAHLSQEAIQVLIADSCGPPVPGHNLTPTERQVLALLVQGLSNKEIAERRVISTSTVKKHVSSILGKLNVNNRAEAAVLAVQHNIINERTRANHPPAATTG